MITSIIFDFDGVILDSNRIKDEAFGILYSQFGSKIKNKVIQYHKLNRGVSRFKKFKIYHEEFLGKKINNKQVQELSEEFSKLVFNKIIDAKFIEGSFEYLKNYCNKIQFHISSATPVEELKKICLKKKILKFFKSINGSPQKKEEHIEIILNKFNLKSNEVVFIGDSYLDYHAAKKFNLSFIFVGNSIKLFKLRNFKYKKLYKINNLYSLSDVIEQINLSLN